MPEDIKIPNNAEVDQALKEFEMKNSGAEQVSQAPTSPKDSGNLDIHFEEDQWKQSMSSSLPKTPKMMQLIIKYSGGAVKDEKQASYVLLAIVIINISIAAFLVFGDSFSPSQNIVPPSALPGGISDPRF